MSLAWGAGIVVGKWKYYPYGAEAESTSGGDNRILFTGHERDGVLGSDYMLARHYGLALARFLSTDPLAESADPGRPQSWDRYSYVADNPLRAVDPTGQLIDEDDEFLFTRLTDPEFEKAYEAWIASDDGWAQYLEMLDDQDTTYVLTVGPVIYTTSSVGVAERAFGLTEPALSWALLSNHVDKQTLLVNAPVVTITIDVAYRRKSCKQCTSETLVREFAETLFHEDRHGLAIGGGRTTWKAVHVLKDALDKDDTDELLLKFRACLRTAVPEIRR